MENMEFCMEVDHFKTLPDNKLAKEAKAIAAKYVGEGTPKAVSHTLTHTHNHSHTHTLPLSSPSLIGGCSKVTKGMSPGEALLP